LKYNYSWVLLLAVSLIGCKPKVQKIELFDLAKLAEQQQQYFEKSTFSITRISILNSISDTLTIDNYLWEEEISSMKSLDLNPTRYKTDYKEENSTAGDQKLLKYTLDLPKKEFTGIYEFSVYYQDDINHPSKIEILQLAHNLVYKQTNRYLFQFVNDGKRHYLNEFSLEGSQDLMMKDPVIYQISSKAIN